MTLGHSRVTVCNLGRDIGRNGGVPVRLADGLTGLQWKLWQSSGESLIPRDPSRRYVPYEGT